ncbi:CLUMA_CG018296, isoform A [Clunio marinus]|uniref:CLUMA_CG018296, isoform A n=1 Tax=Clunio marinus TaxID=568069 RepID=A0A1J1IY44_9DIPT|nr:CLUMA_CG018296, isoform A [Clunio marinus]
MDEIIYHIFDVISNEILDNQQHQLICSAQTILQTETFKKKNVLTINKGSERVVLLLFVSIGSMVAHEMLLISNPNVGLLKH